MVFGCLAYKEESKEEVLQSEDDIKKNWVKKLCNHFKKPTGWTGQDIKDQVAQCIAMNHKIRAKSSAGILWVSLENEKQSKIIIIFGLIRFGVF